MATKYPAIIIGAGIGGLTTAAYLSKVGIPFLLLEQTDSLGGRCSTRMINGHKFEIGALYIGGGVFDHLRKTFGVKCPTIPIRCGVRVGDHMVSFPIGWKTLWELKTCGVPYLEILRFLYRCRILSDPLTFENYKSVGQTFDKLTTNEFVRQLLDAIFGVSGVSPYRLPSRYLSKGNPVALYKAANPEALPEGNGKISSTLSGLALKSGKIIFNTSVNRILVNNGCAFGVKTNQGEYKGKVVVSNTGLRSTVLSLTDSAQWQEDYYRQVKNFKKSLKVVNIFIAFSRSFKLPPGFAVFFVCHDVNKSFQILEQGSFPTQPMYILHIPSNIEPNSSGDHRATLQFYYPRGQVTSQCLDDQVHRVMHDGLERLFEGFSKAIKRYVVYDPERYEREFGFPPYVFGVSPDLNYQRFPIHTPITNLYCVGDSVMPEGPCVPQAMESGLACAREIVDQYGLSF